MSFIKKIFRSIGKTFRNILGDTGFQIFNIILAIVGIATGNPYIIGLSIASSIAYASSLDVPSFDFDTTPFDWKELRFGRKERVPLIFGFSKIAPNIVYAETKGERNETLQLLGILAEEGKAFPFFEVNRLPAGFKLEINQNEIINKHFEVVLIHAVIKNTSGILETKKVGLFYKNGSFDVSSDFNVSYDTQNKKWIINYNNGEIIGLHASKNIPKFYKDIAILEIIDDTKIKIKWKMNHTRRFAFQMINGKIGNIYAQKGELSNEKLYCQITNQTTEGDYEVVEIEAMYPIANVYVDKFGSYSQGKQPMLWIWDKQNHKWQIETLKGNMVDVFTYPVLSGLNYYDYNAIYMELYYKAGYFDEFTHINCYTKGIETNEPAEILVEVLKRMGYENDEIIYETFESLPDDKKISLVVTNQKAQDIINILLNILNATLIEKGNKVFLKRFNIDQVKETITDTDIIENSLSINMPDIRNLPERIDVKFINPKRNFEQDKITITTGVVKSNKTMTITLPIIMPEDAELLGIYYLERSIFDMDISIMVKPELLGIDKYDTIKLDVQNPHLSGLFRVVDKKIVDIQGTSVLTLKPEDKKLYDYEVNIAPYNFESYDENDYTVSNCILPEVERYKVELSSKYIQGKGIVKGDDYYIFEPFMLRNLKHNIDIKNFQQGLLAVVMNDKYNIKTFSPNKQFSFVDSIVDSEVLRLTMTTNINNIDDCSDNTTLLFQPNNLEKSLLILAYNEPSDLLKPYGFPCAFFQYNTLSDSPPFLVYKKTFTDTGYKALKMVYINKGDDRKKVYMNKSHNGSYYLIENTSDGSARQAFIYKQQVATDGEITFSSYKHLRYYWKYDVLAYTDNVSDSSQFGTIILSYVDNKIFVLAHYNNGSSFDGKGVLFDETYGTDYFFLMTLQFYFYKKTSGSKYRGVAISPARKLVKIFKWGRYDDLQVLWFHENKLSYSGIDTTNDQNIWYYNSLTKRLVRFNTISLTAVESWTIDDYYLFGHENAGYIIHCKDTNRLFFWNVYLGKIVGIFDLNNEQYIRVYHSHFDWET